MDSAQAARLRASLDAAETARLERFHRRSDRERYLLAHALVRGVLSRYASVDPGDWSFAANRWGRPRIAGPPGAPPLRFSLSHTPGLVACAVGRDCDCGVDVEALERRGDPLRVAPRVLAAAELEELRAQPEASRRERFLTYWTLKEATTKALGKGLTQPFREIAFAFADGDVRLDSAIPGDEPEDALWQFAVLRPTPAHALALAVRRRGGPARTLIVRAEPPVVD
jgi:4'-phosphopantetheinyl transferase